MKVLVTGATGQLGYELHRSLPSGVELVGLDAASLDITVAGAVQEVVQRENPDLIINAAAYTAVDKAETDRERAFAVNATGAENLARAASECRARLIHVSTDFVFNGNKSTPWLPSDPCEPLGAYGESKREGELRVLEAQPHALIMRTAWLYSAHGSNFVKTMLRLMNERATLGIIADQIGTPTWAHTLAQAIWQAASRPQVSGIHHWTDAGVASWYDFAVAIREEGARRGLMNRSVEVRPIRSADYPTPARRPSFSVLDKTATWQALDVTPMHWREALRLMMDEL